jgi:hypothetical protein
LKRDSLLSKRIISHTIPHYDKDKTKFTRFR